MFDLAWEKPQPLVPRRHRLDIPERIDAEGRVVTPLDVDAVRAAAAFFKEEEVESIAVCFLHSYRNPSHELLAREILEAVFPGAVAIRSEEHTSELQSLMRISYGVLCLKKKNQRLGED